MGWPSWSPRSREIRERNLSAFNLLIEQVSCENKQFANCRSRQAVMMGSLEGLEVEEWGAGKMAGLIPTDDVEMVVLLYDPASWAFDVTR